MMNRIRSLLSLAAACVLLAACESTTTISTLPRLLEDVPTRIQVEGRELTLETYLYRDFMPESPPDGRPLIAGLRVRAVDGGALPAGLSADSVAVVYRDEVWTAPVVVVEQSSRIPNILELVARNGPKWPTGATVDAVLFLHDAGGRNHRLRAAGQTIHRTD